jgi:hypothetical protein
MWGERWGESSERDYFFALKLLNPTLEEQEEARVPAMEFL